MVDRSALVWSSLHILTADRYRAIKDVYGTLAEARKHLGQELLEGLGCRSETVTKALLRLEEFNEEAYASEMEKRGIKLVTLDDAEYPKHLLEIADPPPFLYFRGDLPLLDQPCIALVGTRQMSKYGHRVTEEFVSPLVAADMVTVSGLAAGIDALVARETLKAGGRTVAVLGHGLSMIYPPGNAKLGEEIVEKGGLLLSEFPLHFPPDTYTFPARNRIIAGLSLGTIVLEAPEKSGAIITAELALGYGRDVFAVPGQIFDPQYAGCHRLIAKSQAKLVTRASEVLLDIGVVARSASDTDQSNSYVPQTPEEELLWKSLTTMPQTVDDLLEKSKLDAAAINATLTMMELAGGARNIGGGMWVRG